MAKIKLTKKELREDEVRTWGHHLVEWVQTNKTLLIIIIAVLFVGIVGSKLYRYRERNINNQANLLYKIVLDSFYRAVAITDPEKNADREKLFEETIKKADTLLSTFPKHPLSRASNMVKGTVLYHKNNFDEAASTFQKVLNSSKTNYEKAEALLGLGYTYENKHFFNNDLPALNQADESYTKAISLAKGSELGYEAMLCKARILEQKKQDKEAIKLYEQVIAECKQASSSEDDKRFKVGTWQYGLFQRYKNYNSIFSFAKDAEFAIDRLKGSSGS